MNRIEGVLLYIFRNRVYWFMVMITFFDVSIFEVVSTIPPHHCCCLSGIVSGTLLIGPLCVFTFGGWLILLRYVFDWFLFIGVHFSLVVFIRCAGSFLFRSCSVFAVHDRLSLVLICFSLVVSCPVFKHVLIVTCIILVELVFVVF